MDRRRFLATVAQTVPALALGEMMLRTGYAQTPSPNPHPAYTLPNHLPKKLSIGMFIWDWITMATPGEPYHDLERVMVGLCERGFNAVRGNGAKLVLHRRRQAPRRDGVLPVDSRL